MKRYTHAYELTFMVNTDNPAENVTAEEIWNGLRQAIKEFEANPHIDIIKDAVGGEPDKTIDWIDDIAKEGHAWVISRIVRHKKQYRSKNGGWTTSIHKADCFADRFSYKISDDENYELYKIGEGIVPFVPSKSHSQTDFPESAQAYFEKLRGENTDPDVEYFSNNGMYGVTTKTGNDKK